MENLRKSLNEKKTTESLLSSFKKRKFSVRFRKKFSIGPNIQDQVNELNNIVAETEDNIAAEDFAAVSDDVFKREFNKSIRLKKTNNYAKNNRSLSLGPIQENRLISSIKNNSKPNDSLLNSKVNTDHGKNKLSFCVNFIFCLIF